MDKSGLNAIYDASKRTIICKDENTPEKQENSKDEQPEFSKRNIIEQNQLDPLPNVQKNKLTRRSTVHGYGGDAPEQPDSYLSSTSRYISVVTYVSLCQFVVGQNQLFLAAFQLTIRNSNNYNWDKDEFTVNLSIASSLFFVGMASAAFTMQLYASISVRKMLITQHCCMAILTPCLTIPNVYVLFICRQLIGFCCGLLRPFGLNMQYQLAPPDLRNITNNVYANFMNFGIISIMTISLFDNDGLYVWRSVMYICGGISIIWVILALTVFKELESPIYLIKNDKENQARNFMKKYMKEEYLEYLFVSFHKVIDMEKEQYDIYANKISLNGKKISKCGYFCNLQKLYNKELQYGSVVALLTSMNFFNAYQSYLLVIIVEDQDDEAQVEVARTLQMTAYVWMGISGLINIIFNLNKYRKVNFLIGIFILGIGWIGCSIAFSYNNFLYAKILLYVLAGLLGASFQATFYTILSEVCNPTILAFSCGIFGVGNYFCVLITPYLIKQVSNYKWYFLAIGIFTLIQFGFGCWYLIETQGLEKKDIHELLRKKRTRKELLQDKANLMTKIKKRLTQVASLNENDELKNKIEVS